MYIKLEKNYIYITNNFGMYLVCFFLLLLGEGEEVNQSFGEDQFAVEEVGS